MFTEQELVASIPKLKKYARRLTNINYEDLVQDTLLQAWSKKDKYIDNGKFNAWILSMMHNIFIESKKVDNRKINSMIPAMNFLEKSRVNPNQEVVISITQCQKLANYKLAEAHGLGYSLEEIVAKNKGLQRTAVYSRIMKFREQKEEFV